MGCGPSKATGALVAPPGVHHTKDEKDLYGTRAAAQQQKCVQTERLSSSSKEEKDEDSPVAEESPDLGRRKGGSPKRKSSPKHSNNKKGMVIVNSPARANMFQVRPGYSSGASSSVVDSAASDDSNNEKNVQKKIRELDGMIKQSSRPASPSKNKGGLAAAGSRHSSTHSLSLSRHSDIVAAIKEDMAADSDLTKNVVRMETPFDTPIEEIYDGVHDGKLLGKGAEGIVRKVVHRATGVCYAMKCLDIGLIDSEEGLEKLRNEISIMCQLDHPNIVRIEEVYESANEIYIVQELCTGGELYDRLEEQEDFHYSEAQCAKLVKNMLSSVRYLHSHGVTHRDLKLENFLFSSKEPDSELRMIDFGFSKHFEQGERLHDIVGTPYTVAPFLLQGDYEGDKIDLWALGVITYLILSGETPFGGLDGESLEEVRLRILRAKVTFEPADIWEGVSNEAKDFVLALLNADPSKIKTAKEMQKHPWLQVWAKKDARDSSELNPKTLTALVEFKESTDMQKLLAEVLSFTLLPEQIVDLRTEFEKIDTDGDGEVSLDAMKRVLMESAEAGTLGRLKEQEVEEMFESIKLRRGAPTIRWHEFLAAGLSQAQVDDRNLRLAFDRLDTQRRGFLTFDDLSDVLGSTRKHEELQHIWLDSLAQCQARWDRIMFSDFKQIMQRPVPVQDGGTLAAVDERRADLENMASVGTASGYRRQARSHSHEAKSSFWTGEVESPQRANPAVLSNHAMLVKQRELQLAVLEASKRFDQKMKMLQSQSSGANLIMKRREFVDIRGDSSFPRPTGSRRHARKKTRSDIQGLFD